MPSTFKTQRRVEFRDTDAAGIIHFSAYFIFMEQAEHDLLRSLGLSVLTRDEKETVSFPRVAASCNFRRPVRFEDIIDIEVRVERLGEKSVTYAVRFTHQGQEVAAGSVTSVCCRMDQHPPQPIPIPARIAEQLKGYVA